MDDNLICAIATPYTDAEISKRERERGALAAREGKPRDSCPWTGGMCAEWWIEGFDQESGLMASHSGKLKHGILYVVTNPSEDHTLLMGEHVRFMADGSLMCREAAGWISPEDVPAALKGVRLRVDKTHLHDRKRRLLEELDSIDRGLGDYTEICF